MLQQACTLNRVLGDFIRESVNVLFQHKLRCWTQFLYLLQSCPLLLPKLNQWQGKFTSKFLSQELLDRSKSHLFCELYLTSSKWKTPRLVRMNQIALHYIWTHPGQVRNISKLLPTSNPYSAWSCLYWQGRNLVQAACSSAAVAPHLLQEPPSRNCKILTNAFPP